MKLKITSLHSIVICKMIVGAGAPARCDCTEDALAGRRGAAPYRYEKEKDVGRQPEKIGLLINF